MSNLAIVQHLQAKSTLPPYLGMGLLPKPYLGADLRLELLPLIMQCLAPSQFCLEPEVSQPSIPKPEVCLLSQMI